MDDCLKHYILGNCYTSLGKYQKAIKEYTAALASFPEATHVLIQRSICKQKLGNWASSLDDARLALKFEKKYQFMSNAWLCAGKSEHELGAIDSAIDAYIKALEFNPDKEDAASALEWIVTNRILNCDPLELQKFRALTKEERRTISLKIYSHFVDPISLNRCTNKEFEYGLTYLKADVLVNVDNDITNRAYSLSLIAICYRHLLKFQFALACMLVSYHLYKRSDAETITITHYCNEVATCFNRQGNYDGAKTYLELAQKYYQLVADSELRQHRKITSAYVDAIASKVNSINILGHAMIRACRFEECIELELGAAKLAEEMDKLPLIEGSRFGHLFRNHASRAMSHVAKSYVKIGQYDNAIYYYNQLLQHPKPFFNPSTTIVQWAKLAFCYSEIEKFQDAIKCITDHCKSENASKIDQIELFTMITGIYENYARFAKKNGKESDAQELYTKALNYAQQGILAAEDADDRQVWWFRLRISQIKLAQNGERNDSEMDELTKAIEIEKNRNELFLLATHYYNRGALHYVQKNYEKAIDDLTAAEEVQSKMTFVNSRDDLLTSFANLDNVVLCLGLMEHIFMIQKNLTKGLEVVDRSRAKSLLKKLNDNKPFQSLSANEILQLSRETNSTLIYYSQPCAMQNETTLRRLLVVWIVRHDDQSIWVTGLNPGTGEIYFQLEKFNGSKAVLDKSNENCMEILRDCRKVNIGHNKAQNEYDHRKLYEIYWRPIAKIVANSKKLVILPNMEQSLLPFAAFTAEDKTRLIENHQITIAPSAGILRSLKIEHQTFSQRNAIIIAAPEMPKLLSVKNLQPLPQAKLEAITVANTIKDCSFQLE